MDSTFTDLHDATSARVPYQSPEDAVRPLTSLGWRVDRLEGVGMSLSRRIRGAKVLVSARDYTGTDSRISMFVMMPVRLTSHFASLSAMWNEWDRVVTGKSFTWAAYGDGTGKPTPKQIDAAAEVLVSSLSSFFDVTPCAAMCPTCRGAGRWALLP